MRTVTMIVGQLVILLVLVWMTYLNEQNLRKLKEIRATQDNYIKAVNSRIDAIQREVDDLARCF